MECKDRSGNIIKQNKSQDKILRYLYENKFGNSILSILIRPWFTKVAGFFLNTRVSTLFIKSFIRNNNIDMNDYEDKKFKSYNEFFIRKIKKEARTWDMSEKHFPSPCDSKLTVCKIDEKSKFNIKDTEYTFEELTRSSELAKEFEDGYIMIFRLSVDDYHRYCYPDSGNKKENIKIDGVFHTVNPLANDVLPIYKENQREYCLLESDNFGRLLIMEVGAMVVGKIVNYHGQQQVERGMEKGRFEFGGSTVIVAVKKDKIEIDEDIIKNSKEGFETRVKIGEKVATLREIEK